MLNKKTDDLTVAETAGASAIVAIASMVGMFAGLYVIGGAASVVTKLKSRKSKKA